MKSVSGKNWEEKKFDKRLIEKIKIENDFNDFLSREVISKNFDKEEIFSIKGHININNPFLKKIDFIKAVELLDNSIKNKEKICIIGDYDVDGCISTSLFVKFLKKLNVDHYFYIPNRFIDGYGSNINLIKKIIKNKTGLIIMLDHGSSSNETIEYLKKNKIKSLIVDHHETYKPYPKSNSLINPKKKSDYSQYNYLSTGVLTYFLIDCFIKKKKLEFNFSSNLYLVLLTIVSDVMPLRKLNRLIAIKVLNNLKIKHEYFFKKIFEIKKINRPIDIDDFAYIFAPLINSAGRLEDPNIIIDLFTSSNIFLKDKIIKKLLYLNQKRKFIQDDIIKSINFKKLNLDKNEIIIYEDKFINEGVIGLIASNFKTYFNKPSVVITKCNNIYKGSVRSTNNFPIGQFIKIAKDLNFLETGGGHNLAAGFTIKKENLDQFKKFLYNACNKIEPDINFYFLSIISSGALNFEFFKEVNKLMPYGEGNIRPYFLIKNIKFIKSKLVNNKFITSYIKIKTGRLISAIYFNILESRISTCILNNKKEFNIIVQLKENLWNNKKNIQLVIIDIITDSNKA